MMELDGGMEVDPDSVLVLIDCQRGFFKRDCVRPLEGRIRSFLKTHGSEFQRIYATQYVNYPDSPAYRMIGWEGLMTSEERELMFRVNPRDVLRKTRYSNAADLMGRMDRDGFGESSIYLAGVDTDVCVLHTAADLFDAWRHVRVLYDLTATNGGDAAYEAALPLLARTIGEEQVVRGW